MADSSAVPVKRAPRRGPTRGAARPSARQAAPTAKAAPASGRPERWRIDAGQGDIATLVIPASLSANRVFEIDVRLLVRASPAADQPWLALTVELDGVQQWQRRVAAACPGASDSLDYHCRRELALGQALRVRAIGKLGGGVRLGLVIEAEQAG